MVAHAAGANMTNRQRGAFAFLLMPAVRAPPPAAPARAPPAGPLPRSARCPAHGRRPTPARSQARGGVAGGAVQRAAGGSTAGCGGAACGGGRDRGRRAPAAFLNEESRLLCTRSLWLKSVGCHAPTTSHQQSCSPLERATPNNTRAFMHQVHTTMNTRPRGVAPCSRSHLESQARHCSARRRPSPSQGSPSGLAWLAHA
jgi:hypothetical protein